MSTTTKTRTGRTDYTVCTCVNGQHHASWHREHSRPTPPSPDEVAMRFPNGHIIRRQIQWTPWETA